MVDNIDIDMIEQSRLIPFSCKPLCGLASELTLGLYGLQSLLFVILYFFEM